MLTTVIRVHGPPGSGKTTAAINEALELIREGVNPAQIGFTTFTRAAVEEYRRRLDARFALPESDDPPRLWVGTLHSLCYRLLGLRPHQVLVSKDWKAFCSAHRLEHTAFEQRPLADILSEPLEETSHTKDGDQMRACWDWHRQGQDPDNPRDIARTMASFSWPQNRPGAPRLKRFIENFESFKRDTRLYDFTDFLTHTYRERLKPPVKYWIVDESQDLSPLQRHLLAFWTEDAAKLSYYGDTDQTIYSFAQADPRWLLELECPVIDLRRSYRVPQAQRDIATRLIKRNKARHPNLFEPNGQPGKVIRREFAEPVWVAEQAIKKLSENPAGQDTTALLARNHYLLNPWLEILNKKGIPYRYPGRFSPIEQAPAGVASAFQLAAGESVTLGSLGALLSVVKATTWLDRGVKGYLEEEAKKFPGRIVTPADLAGTLRSEKLASQLRDPQGCLIPLSGITSFWRDYYYRLVRQSGLAALLTTPRLTISSIHSAKGAEFDQVILSTGLAHRTWQGIWHGGEREAERRVWYVALTRSRETLTLVTPPQKFFYEEI